VDDVNTMMEYLASAKYQPHRANCQNTLLKSLPEEDLSELLPQFERVALRRRGIVQFSNASMNHVYFIETGLISVLADTGHGKSVETRMIGPEGCVGIRVVLGKRESCHRRMVQIGGSALRIEADEFAKLIEKNKKLHQAMLEYVHTVVIQASQLSACNAHHTIQQRLARWLLMALERCGTEHLSITQKMLSRPLGVRRASIGACLAEMEEQGILQRSRSLISIQDHGKLEDIACKCYGLISRAGRN
jgi:CRP-like cAMP-binding protein